MNRIEKPSLRKKFWKMMIDADAQVVHKAYIRKVVLPDGKIIEKEYFMKPQELERTKIERVFSTLLNWYTDHYNKMIASMPDTTYSDDSVDNLPMLVTTNINIGKSAGCSDRTARTMLNILCDMGVIIRTNKGTKGGIGIRFQIGFLWGQTVEERQDSKPLMVCPIGSNWKKFPHIDTLVYNTEKGNTKNVDLWTSEKDSNCHRKRGEQTALENGNKRAQLGTEMQKREKQAGGADAESYPQRDVNKPQTALNEAKKALQEQAYDEWTEKCRQVTMNFWQYSFGKLYSNRSYDKETVRIILKTIWTDVFNSFTHIRNEKELATFASRQTSKIDRAAKWYDYHNEAYLPDPHSIVVAGKGYFDKKNTRGFAGLEAWMRAEEAKTKKHRADWINPVEFKTRKIERLLMQSRKDFEKVRIGATRRVEVSHLDIIGLQQYYGTIFSILGSQAHNRYNQQIIDLQKRDFRPISTGKKRSKFDTVKIVEVDSWMGSFEGYYST